MVEYRRRLQEQRWYYGLCTRDMVAPLLKKKGDFIVRATQKGDKYSITINVRNEKSVDNFQVSLNKNNEYVLHMLAKEKNSKTFSTVMELIEYYKEHTLPNKVRLHTGIKRPNWLIAPRNVFYNKEDMMGSGNFSDVYRGTVRRRANTIGCAIKVLHFNEAAMTEESARQKFLSEAKMQSVYKHENIVAMIGVVLDCPPIMMIMELCCGGSLDKHMQKRGKKIGLFEKQLYLLEAAQGMRYLHSQGCIHRDLAARNCLIGSDGKIKISDFGLSLFSPDGETVNSKMSQVPLRWMAPECLRRDQAFSPKTDIWAYGVLAYEVFSNGSKPFADADTDSAEFRMIKAIRRADMPPMPEGTPEGVVVLVKDIWQRDPSIRPDFVSIVLRLCAALRKEKAPPIGELVLAELPKVELKEMPELDWTEEKEREREKQRQKEIEREKERRERKRGEIRSKYKKGGKGTTKEPAPVGPISSSSTTKSRKSTRSSGKRPSETQQKTLEENGKKKKMTLTKLVECKMKADQQEKGKKSMATPTPSQMTVMQTMKIASVSCEKQSCEKQEKKAGEESKKKKTLMIGPGEQENWGEG